MMRLMIRLIFFNVAHKERKKLGLLKIKLWSYESKEVIILNFRQ